jgi:hypothetical protein
MWVFVLEIVNTADYMITNCTDITGSLISYTTTFLTLYALHFSRKVMWVFVMDTVYTADCMITKCTDITGPIYIYTNIFLTVYAVHC